MTHLHEIAAGWPLAASMAAVVTVQGLRAGRRREALNRALHEVRRPLQAIALATGGEPDGVEGSVRLVAAALEQLDREINGGALRRVPETVSVRPLLESAVGRWRARTNPIGGSLVLRWRAGRAVVDGDRSGLSQALDNLIVNAIEHGGPAIVVDAQLHGRRLRVSVADSGRAVGPAPGRAAPAAVIARLSGRRRHGHGLAVVRRVAAAHDGRFALRCSESGSLAVLELPVAANGAELAA